MSALPPAFRLYAAATAALEPLAPFLLARRARRRKENPDRLSERLGRTTVERPPGALVWLHGASVGESLSLLPLIDALRARRPDLVILVTSGTVTSADLLQRRLPRDAIHQFAPIDSPAAAKRFLDHWRPSLAVVVESELWPNLMMNLHGRGTPVALVSARLSEASLSRWARAPATAQALLSGLALVLAQEDATADRLSTLGAPDHGRLNLKLAGSPPPVDHAALEGLRRAAAGRPVLLAASTHAGEEAAAMTAFVAALADRPDRPLLVIAPRHPGRGPAIASLAAAGLPVDRQGAGDAFGAGPIYVADTLGELGTWFRLAASVFIGGSLAPGVGGHNPVEAAQLGAPVVIGPHLANWNGVYAALRATDAVVEVEDAAGLARAWAADLDQPAAAARRAERARAVVAEAASGLEAAADALTALLA